MVGLSGGSFLKGNNCLQMVNYWIRQIAEVTNMLADAII
jgi:hypothetical protein